MKKATHKGICQVCGRQQRLPGDFVSKHGYTVEWGWFNGVCPGSDELPFEKSKDLIDKAIEDVKQNIVALQEEIETVTADGFTDFVWVHHYGQLKMSHKSGYTWMKVQPVKELRREGSKYTAWYYYVEGSEKRKELQMYGQGDELTDVCRTFNERYANTLRKRIKGGHEYITWQEARIKDWKETDCEPIK